MSETTTATKKRPPRMTFDTAARDRLRAKLLGYMKEHAIGVPSLQARIAEATDRSPDLIVLKTLQRFLGNQGRTHDGFLIPCFQFAESFPAHDELQGVASEVAGFFGAMGMPEGGGAKEATPDRLLGTYGVIAGGEGYSGVWASRPGDEFQTGSPHGRCTIERIPGTSLCKVRELAAPDPKGTKTREALVRRVYDGLLLFFDPLVLIVLRDRLTRLPRVMWLSEDDDGRVALYGHFMQALFDGKQTNRIHPYSDIRAVEFYPSTTNE